MHFSKIFKVKEGKLETVKEWFTTLSTTRKEEALATFEYEGVVREVFALFEGKDGNHYVIGLNETASEDGVPGSSDPTVAINQEHSAVKKECLEPISNPGKILMDLRL